MAQILVWSLLGIGIVFFGLFCLLACISLTMNGVDASSLWMVVETALGAWGFLQLGLLHGYEATRLIGLYTTRRQHERFAAFAEANGLEYWPERLPGLGRVPKYVRRFLGRRPQQFVVADVLGGNGDPVNATSGKFGGIIDIESPNDLPNIVLRHTGRRLPGISNKASIDSSQRLRLEGDFDRYFHLYCPPTATNATHSTSSPPM
ncbi:hypothetical protein [Pseudoclavibacter sp. 13-3]|uniref:hypothetical protein n=1 Tax=Pseudoclavibacter sp. 13-3 TaxID=2901228 RepID=UPI001E3B6AD4|nr:hypothetical protein [Pseudoclavibacter sp. 13-3]MCD7102374.1 hypothetical protein [Pseudoclavibacter sp. 13-3]